MTTPLPDLIAALESAADGNVMLDALVAEVVCEQGDAVALADDPVGTRLQLWKYPDGSQGTALRYTRSVDAALTLVPEGWLWGVNNNGPETETVLMGYAIMWPKFTNDYHESYASTPALAICAAALRARQEEVK